MITASHNPKEYNGMKSLSHKGEPYNLKKYGGEMVAIMNSLNIPYTGKVTNREERDVSNDWVEHILNFIGDVSELKDYTIVADGGNGTA